VVSNCIDAARRGAVIRTRTRVLAAARDAGRWRVMTSGPNGRGEYRARALINASGPWVRSVLAAVSGAEPKHRIRLVKGSHIVTQRLYDGDHAFILQNGDGRVILVMPYRGRYSLIGTTDIPQTGRPEEAIISAEEIAYLCTAVNRYFRRSIASSDVLWSFSGVRPLYDDGSTNPSEVTRDYKLVVDDSDRGAPLLSIYGGKITTYRRLAEQALHRLRPWFPQLGPEWTARVPLPGGDFKGGPAAMAAALAPAYPELPRALLEALASRHGMATRQVLGDVRTLAELGAHFGESLYAREVDYLVNHEWAVSPDDILWRRTKAGLSLDDNSQQALARYMAARGRTPEASVRVP